MRESAVQVDVRLVYGQADGFVVWRNNSGIAEFNGQKVRYGVGIGGADLLGVAPGGLFLAVEIKTLTGRLEPDQLRFLELVWQLGGVACVCRSEEQAKEQVRGIREGIRRHGW
jgi:hypothetical protein